MTYAKRAMQRHGLVMLLLGLAALITIYPVLPAPRWRVMGWRGDNVQYVYITGHVAQALLEGEPLLTDLRLNYPDTLALTSTDVPYLSMLVVAPIAMLFTPTLAYNVIILVSAWLSGLFAHLWLYKLTGSRVAGLGAGLLFVLTPYRIAHSYGHLQLISTQFIPLFFWALDSGVSKSFSIRRMALLMLVTALLAASSQYYLLMCAILGVAYFLLRLPTVRALFSAGLRCATAIVTGAVIGSLPYLLTLKEGVYRNYAIDETRDLSASLADFFAPAVHHPLWAEPMFRLYPRAGSTEFVLYLGWVALGLALMGIFGRHRSPALSAGLLRTWVGVGLIALLLALGTDLHLAYGQPVNAAQPFYLPMHWLGQWPVLNLMRVWARFGVIIILFVCLLAGFGLAQLQTAWADRRWQRPALAACFALLLLDFAPGYLRQVSLLPRKIDQWLAQQPGEFSVALLPVSDDIYGAMLGSLSHRKHVIAYNHPQHVPRLFQQFAEATKNFPQPSAQQALCPFHLRYLILNSAAFDKAGQLGWKTIEAQLQPAGWHRVQTVDGFVILDAACTNN